MGDISNYYRMDISNYYRIRAVDPDAVEIVKIKICSVNIRQSDIDSLYHALNTYVVQLLILVRFKDTQKEKWCFVGKGAFINQLRLTEKIIDLFAFINRNQTK